MVSKLWLAESRSVFFAKTTIAAHNPFHLCMTPVRKLVHMVSMHLGWETDFRVLDPLENNFPRMISLHLTISTGALEELGIDVWNTEITDGDFAECEQLGWITAAPTLKSLSVDFELEDRFDPSQDLRTNCHKNLALLRSHLMRSLAARGIERQNKSVKTNAACVHGKERQQVSSFDQSSMKEPSPSQGSTAFDSVTEYIKYHPEEVGEWVKQTQQLLAESQKLHGQSQKLQAQTHKLQNQTHKLQAQTHKLLTQPQSWC